MVHYSVRNFVFLRLVSQRQSMRISRGTKTRQDVNNQRLLLEISLIKGATYQDFTASTYVVLGLCLCAGESLPLQYFSDAVRRVVYVIGNPRFSSSKTKLGKVLCLEQDQANYINLHLLNQFPGNKYRGILQFMLVSYFIFTLRDTLL